MVRGTLSRMSPNGEKTLQKRIIADLSHSYILFHLQNIGHVVWQNTGSDAYFLWCTTAIPLVELCGKVQDPTWKIQGKKPHIFMSGIDFSECFANSSEVWNITKAFSLIKKCTLLFSFCPCVDSDWNNLSRNFVQLRPFRTWKYSFLIRGRDYFKILVITLL